MTYKDYYALIADILSFRSNTTTLGNKLQSPGVNWEMFVYHSTAQLVLPAVYCRLKQRELLALLPDDLVLYMAQFTSINRNRNRAILKQLQDLTALLDMHGVRYVYLKGAAMLAGNYYTDIAERMIGDIDLLVAEKDMLRVYGLLKDHGYAEHGGKQFLIRRTGKHLPKMCSEQYIASVEIHRWLFNKYRCRFLKELDVLVQLERRGGYPLPSLHHLLLHNVLNWQINDKAFFNKSIGFRAIYDTLLIAGKGTVVQLPLRQKYLMAYTGIAAVFFKEFQTNVTRSTLIFKLKMNSPRFNTVFTRLNHHRGIITQRYFHYKRLIVLLFTSSFHQKKAMIKLYRLFKPKKIAVVR
jgi:hypothetical protein